MDKLRLEVPACYAYYRTVHYHSSTHHPPAFFCRNTPADCSVQWPRQHDTFVLGLGFSRSVSVPAYDCRAVVPWTWYWGCTWTGRNPSHFRLLWQAPRPTRWVKESSACASHDDDCRTFGVCRLSVVRLVDSKDDPLHRANHWPECIWIWLYELAGSFMVS